jgi:hypothetical protein
MIAVGVSNAVTSVGGKEMMESTSARARTLPTVIEMGILISRRDNWSTLNIETHRLNLRMRYRKNSKGRANVPRKLKRFKSEKDLWCPKRLGRAHTHWEACLPWEYFCWLIRLTRPGPSLGIASGRGEVFTILSVASRTMTV